VSGAPVAGRIHPCESRQLGWRRFHLPGRGVENVRRAVNPAEWARDFAQIEHVISTSEGVFCHRRCYHDPRFRSNEWAEYDRGDSGNSSSWGYWVPAIEKWDGLTVRRSTDWATGK